MFNLISDIPQLSREILQATKRREMAEGWRFEIWIPCKKYEEMSNKICDTATEEDEEVDSENVKRVDKKWRSSLTFYF